MALAGDHVQVLVDSDDLTGDHNKIQVDDSRQLLEATAFGMAAQRFIGGQRTLQLNHNGYLNPDATQSHPVLNGVAVDGVVSVLMGNNAAPTAGDPAFSMLVQQQMYQTKPEVGQVIPFSAKFSNRGNNGGWGRVLHVPTVIDAASPGYAGPLLDDGSQATNGAIAFLHVLTASTDTHLIRIFHSDTGASGSFSSAGDFTLDGTSVGSEALILSQTIKRFVRLWLDNTGTDTQTVELAATLVRF